MAADQEARAGGSCQKIANGEQWLVEPLRVMPLIAHVVRLFPSK